MARIIDKSTRLIDIDFGPVSVSCSRPAGDLISSTTLTSGNGTSQLIKVDRTIGITGSFVQYSRIDLEFMTMNNEIMLPKEVSVQRTSPIPTGSNNNGNNTDVIEEYVYVFTRPLNNTEIERTIISIENFRDLGLDRSELFQSTAKSFAGKNAGLPNQEQTIYAEKRIYSYSEQQMATVRNGELEDPRTQTPPLPLLQNTLAGMPRLDNISTWGSLGAITGPNLHCYRVVINRTQNIPTNDFVNASLDGNSSLRFPPVNITLMCVDPKYTEGEYLTRIANAMNSIPIDGDTA